ncbi:MAG: hypothetical protein WD696_04395 [Bryobacteraceae bacterium]
MDSSRAAACLLICGTLAAPQAKANPGFAPAPEIDQAFTRLYNFDFSGSHAVLDQHIAANPSDPLGFAVRASAYLFHELDRLGILEGEFFADDKRLIDKKKLKPDPDVRAKFFATVDAAQTRALAVIKSDPDDRNALFALCIASGVVTDYVALIEKKQFGSLSHVKKSTQYAQRLLKLDPQFYDAYLTTGLTEYLIGSLPFFVRWFIRIDHVEGDKDQGIRNLELVAREGRYLKPFAKVLLAMVYLREKRPLDTQRLLVELSGAYPENKLFRKELAKVTAKIGSGGGY